VKCGIHRNGIFFKHTKKYRFKDTGSLGHLSIGRKKLCLCYRPFESSYMYMYLLVSSLDTRAIYNLVMFKWQQQPRELSHLKEVENHTWGQTECCRLLHVFYLLVAWTRTMTEEKRRPNYAVGLFHCLSLAKHWSVEITLLFFSVYCSSSANNYV
jgi:hypothetical protein